MNPFLLKSTAYSLLLSTLVCLLFFIARFGLLNDIYLGIEILGISYFLLITPFFTDLLLAKWNGKLFIINPLTGGITLIILLGITGWFDLYLFSWGFIALGYVGCIAVFFLFVIKIKWIDFLSLLIIVFLSVWVASVYWSGGFLAPIFIEKIILGNYSGYHNTGLDALFHISFSQMIKTYGISSTGLNDVPFMKYHFGSHFLFASLSRLTRINVFTWYNLGYPVVFVPLFFLYFYVMIYYAQSFITKTFTSFNFYFWFIILSGFIGILYNHSDSFTLKAGVYSNVIVVSESYLISLIFLFGVLTLIIDYLNRTDFKAWRQEACFLFIIIPLLIFLIGLIKISTVYIAVGLFGFLYLRLELFKIKKYNIALGLNLITLIILYFLTFEKSYSDEKFEILAFFWNYIHTKFIIFLFTYFFWSILFIVLNIYDKGIRFNKKDLINDIIGRKFLYAEIILYISFIGFLPGFFLKIQGGSAGYFSEVQNWIALILVTAYLPVIKGIFSKIKAKYTKAKFVIPVSLTLLFVFAYINFYRNIKLLADVALDSNLISRSWYANYRMDPRTELEGSLLKGNFNRIERILDSLGAPVQENLNNNIEYLEIQKLFALDTLPLIEKRKSAIFIQDYGILKDLLPCFKRPFLIPAITGICGLGNYYFNICPEFGYTREYYNKQNSLWNYNICDDVPKHFSTLHIINFKRNKFERINCVDTLNH